MDIVYRKFLFVLHRGKDGDAFEVTCQSSKKCDSFQKFVDDCQKRAEEFDLPPPMKDMVHALRKCGDRGVGDGGEIAQAKSRQSTTANNTPFFRSLSSRDYVSFCETILMLEKHF